MTTIGRTLDLLRRCGFICAVVESWIPRIDRRRDLFRFADVLAAHPVRRVNHPGSRANPFMERIIAAAQPDIDAMFGQALTQITEAIAAT